MSCAWHERGAVELHFYGELEGAERAGYEAHLPGCEVCRSSLEELRTIALAIGDRRFGAAPPGQDWSSFMGRLDERLDREQTSRSGARWLPGGLAGMLRVAALVALVTAAVLGAQRWAPWRQPAALETTLATRGASAGALVATLSEEHLERSKLVLLGLATKDPRDARPVDWRYERELAAEMLADTAQFRLAANQQGMAGLADVLGDLEVVLLQASLSDEEDPDALARLQNLIRKRDLLVKIEVMGVLEPRRPERSPAGRRRGGTGI